MYKRIMWIIFYEWKSRRYDGYFGDIVSETKLIEEN